MLDQSGGVMPCTPHRTFIPIFHPSRHAGGNVKDRATPDTPASAAVHKIEVGAAEMGASCWGSGAEVPWERRPVQPPMCLEVLAQCLLRCTWPRRRPAGLGLLASLPACSRPLHPAAAIAFLSGAQLTAGAEAQWETLEEMPYPRVLGDAVTLCDGTVGVFGGGERGIAVRSRMRALLRVVPAAAGGVRGGRSRARGGARCCRAWALQQARGAPLVHNIAWNRNSLESLYRSVPHACRAGAPSLTSIASRTAPLGTARSCALVRAADRGGPILLHGSEAVRLWQACPAAAGGESLASRRFPNPACLPSQLLPSAALLPHSQTCTSSCMHPPSSIPPPVSACSPCTQPPRSVPG